MKPLSDIAAERAILSGICQYGSLCYTEIADIIEEQTFTSQYNKLVFSCIKHAFSTSGHESIDLATIYSAGKDLGLSEMLSNSDYTDHIDSLFNFAVDKNNVRTFATKIKKLQITRSLRDTLENASKQLLEIDGNETISHILGTAEEAVFNFSSTLNNADGDTRLLGDGLIEYVDNLAKHPVEQLGISTGMPRYDKAIGGGFRPGTINVIGARVKVGKSILGGNIGYHIAKQGIPVLAMDTEMSIEDHRHRILAMESDCFIFDIETGKFAQKPGQSKKIKKLARYIEKHKVPYHHRSIASMPFDEQMSIMRRWLVKDVGLNSDGTAKPCVIVYDYLKLMTSEKITNNIKEYQALGFMMTQLHDFAVKYKLPMLTFIQLNRDGVTEEGTNVASGSDRITWFCSNFTIFKPKSNEEIAENGLISGNRKMVPIICRHGAGLQSGDYINCFMQGDIAKITEGQTAFEHGSTEQVQQEEIDFRNT